MTQLLFESTPSRLFRNLNRLNFYLKAYENSDSSQIMTQADSEASDKIQLMIPAIFFYSESTHDSTQSRLEACRSAQRGHYSGARAADHGTVPGPRSRRRRPGLARRPFVEVGRRRVVRAGYITTNCEAAGPGRAAGDGGRHEAGGSGGLRASQSVSEVPKNSYTHSSEGFG